MTVNNHHIRLDVCKRSDWRLPELVLRQGDLDGTALVVSVTDHGKPLKLDGYTGEAITPGTNVVATTVMAEIVRLTA